MMDIGLTFFTDERIIPVLGVIGIAHSSVPLEFKLQKLVPELALMAHTTH
jgi:hypothetical protein